MSGPGPAPGPEPTHALELPEIIFRVGQFLPLWSPADRGSFVFEPKTLLACTLVSHSFRQAMLPTLWYIFDHKLMRKVPEAIMFKYSHHFRILGLDYPLNVSRFPPSAPPPFDRSLSCTRLIDLRIYGYEPPCLDLLQVNPQLQNILWAGTTEYSDESVPILDPDLLNGLTHLQSLRLCEWDLGHDRALLPMLQSVQESLKVLRLDTISGGEEGPPRSLPTRTDNPSFLRLSNGDGDAPPQLRIKDLTMDLQFSHSHQLLDLVCFCPELEDLTLIAACGADLDRLVQNLSRHCPNLSRIHVDGLYFGLFDTYHILEDAQFAALIQCCQQDSQLLPRSLSSSGEFTDGEERGNGSASSRRTRTRSGLKGFRADIQGLEPMVTQALIDAGSSLLSLHLTIHRAPIHMNDDDDDANADGEVLVVHRPNNIKRDQAELQRILQACPNLEKVQLEYEDSVLSHPSMFTVDPRWQSIVKVLNTA